MVRNGIRRCDLCASEILGHGGPDICLVCRICMEDDPHCGESADPAALAEAEGFTLSAVVGRSHSGAQSMVAANDDRNPRAAVSRHPRRRTGAHRFSVPEGVQRFADGLRSISRKHWS